MRYDEEFKAAALHDLRESGRPVSAIARERGVSPSTLVRWQQRADRPVEPPARPVQAPADLEAREVDEVNEVVSWLDREQGETRARLQVAISRHVRWMRIYNGIVTVLAWLVVVLASLVALDIYFDLQATEPPTTLRVYVAWMTGLLVTVYLALLFVDAVCSRIASLRGPFVMAVLRIFAAEHLLEQDISFALVNPRWWHVPARWRRRQLKRHLREAEALLSRRTRLGKAFQTGGAREWELTQRQQAASVLACAEVSLEQRGSSAYESARKHLRQLAYLTLLREWAVDHLPQLPEAAGRYQSPMVRVAQHLWAPVPLLGALVTLLLAVPEIQDRLF